MTTDKAARALLIRSRLRSALQGLAQAQAQLRDVLHTVKVDSPDNHTPLVDIEGGVSVLRKSLVVEVEKWEGFYAARERESKIPGIDWS